MIESYQRFWNNITNFSDTASRPDYWWPVIINYIVGVILLFLINAATGHGIYNLVNTGAYIIAAIIWLGTLSVKVRRLHDTDRSGWWVLIGFVPFIGTIWFFILMVLPSKQSRWS